MFRRLTVFVSMFLFGLTSAAFTRGEAGETIYVKELVFIKCYRGGKFPLRFYLGYFDNENIYHEEMLPPITPVDFKQTIKMVHPKRPTDEQVRYGRFPPDTFMDARIAIKVRPDTMEVEIGIYPRALEKFKKGCSP